MTKIIPKLLVTCLMLSCIAHAKELSTKELRAIGKQYITAWESGDIENVKAFFLHPEKVTDSKFNQYQEAISRLRVNEVGDGYVSLDVKRESHQIWWNLYESSGRRTSQTQEHQINNHCCPK